MKSQMKEITPRSWLRSSGGIPGWWPSPGPASRWSPASPTSAAPGGLWDRFDPMEYAHIRAFRANPAKVWAMLKEMDAVITRARPNPAHYALAELEAKGFLTGIITQNVDNLHQAAGSKAGGGVSRQRPALHLRYLPEATTPGDLDFSHTPLYCLCGGLIRPDVVFFGEAIPAAAQAEAEELAQHCDLLLVIGTSGEVAPASYIPNIAREWSTVIVEVNLEPTRLTHSLTDHFLPGPAGQCCLRFLKNFRGIKPDNLGAFRPKISRLLFRKVQGSKFKVKEHDHPELFIINEWATGP